MAPTPTIPYLIICLLFAFFLFLHAKLQIFFNFYFVIIILFVSLQSLYNFYAVGQEELRLLSKIQYPKDLRKLKVDELPQVCDELRQDIVQELSVNPGHLASSLGVAEITVALHYVYNTPEDRIVWDVGHQAYGHKILTGRREQFCTNRKLGGIKPFPSPTESEYDTFACGHASNSISAALGMAVAAKLEGNKDRHVVAVIGDGAMSGGRSAAPCQCLQECHCPSAERIRGYEHTLLRSL